jgi:hypothetical protein
VQLIVFGVQQMNSGIDVMEAADLFLQSSCDGASFIENRNFDFGTTDGKLKEPGGKLWSIVSWCLRARCRA